MERKVDAYDHMNKPDYAQGELEVRMPLDEFALKVLKMNYGFQRFLSAARRAVKNPNNKLDYMREEIEAAIKGFESLPR